MKYKILFAPHAIIDLKRLSARHRAELMNVIEGHLRHQPRRLSKSRIKKLRGLNQPQYRMRVGELRLFYDVADDVVEILAIVRKSDASEWLVKGGKES
jgi:mRNA interferase RelE/StbE